jgi:hypothetical protein
VPPKSPSCLTRQPGDSRTQAGKEWVRRPEAAEQRGRKRVCVCGEGRGDLMKHLCFGQVECEVQVSLRGKCQVDTGDEGPP